MCVIQEVHFIMVDSKYEENVSQTKKKVSVWLESHFKDILYLIITGLPKTKWTFSGQQCIDVRVGCVQLLVNCKSKLYFGLWDKNFQKTGLNN